jgi:hypothetical protein
MEKVPAPGQLVAEGEQNREKGACLYTEYPGEDQAQHLPQRQGRQLRQAPGRIDRAVTQKFSMPALGFPFQSVPETIDFRFFLFSGGPAPARREKPLQGFFLIKIDDEVENFFFLDIHARARGLAQPEKARAPVFEGFDFAHHPRDGAGIPAQEDGDVRRPPVKLPVRVEHEVGEAGRARGVFFAQIFVPRQRRSFEGAIIGGVIPQQRVDFFAIRQKNPELHRQALHRVGCKSERIHRLSVLRRSRSSEEYTPKPGFGKQRSTALDIEAPIFYPRAGLSQFADCSGSEKGFVDFGKRSILGAVQQIGNEGRLGNVHAFAELVENLFMFGGDGHVNTFEAVGLHFLTVYANTPRAFFFNFVCQSPHLKEFLFEFR